MLLSIRKIFSNLKLALLFILLGITLLFIELYHLSRHSDRLSALQAQHLLIEKIVLTNTDDPKMAAILVNGALLELEFSLKHSEEKSFIDSIIASDTDQSVLVSSLALSSQNFRNSAAFWVQSADASHASMHERMMTARTAYLADIDRMTDYQIYLLSEIISAARISALLILILSLFVYFRYRSRLGQIYRDINYACAVDVEGTKAHLSTKEIDFILKRIVRKSPQDIACPALQHTLSGLNNEKGMLTAFNAKKAGRAGNSLFLGIFEIDRFVSLVNSLSKEDLEGIYRKLANIILMYEQPFDVIAQLENDHIVFFLSRNSKDSALSDCEKILHSVEESIFTAANGTIKITLSGGFLLKSPAKTLEEVIEEGEKLIEKAKENGGNRIAQLRSNADSYHR